MRLTRLISALTLGPLACAHTYPSPIPASRPAVLYQPIDEADPTKGFFVSYSAAQGILESRYKARMECGDAKLNLQESNELCQAELKAQSPDWFSRFGVPILLGLTGLGIGFGVGYAAHQ